MHVGNTYLGRFLPVAIPTQVRVPETNIDLCWKVKKKKMARAISTKNWEKASTAKTLSKPLPGDTYLGLEPAISFYEIEENDNNE